jgi:hypothetical protein
MAHSRNQSLSRFDSAVRAEQIQSRSGVLRLRPLDSLIARRGAWLPGAPVIVDISGGTDEVDCSMKLLIAQPTLVFFAPLKEGPSANPYETNQSTDDASKKGVHRFKVGRKRSTGAIRHAPQNVTVRSAACARVC